LTTDRCREAYKTLKILTVEALYIKEVVLHLDKENQLRLYNIHNHNPRNAALYPLPRHHLTLYEKKLTYMGMKMHNCLPLDLWSKTGQNLKTALTAWQI
jgi:hypothetical protein